MNGTVLTTAPITFTLSHSATPFPVSAKRPRHALISTLAAYSMIGSQLINELTGWDGHRAFNLMSLALPKRGELESTDQELARTIVERCLQESFGFKLAHGLIIKVLGQTLGSLWRSHEGSDDVPGTYAHWLRFGIAHWCQDKYQPALVLEVIEPVKRGPLLRDA